MNSASYTIYKAIECEKCRGFLIIPRDKKWRLNGDWSKASRKTINSYISDMAGSDCLGCCVVARALSQVALVRLCYLLGTSKRISSPSKVYVGEDKGSGLLQDGDVWIREQIDRYLDKIII